MKHLTLLCAGLAIAAPVAAQAVQPQRVYTSGGTFEFRPEMGYAKAIVIGKPDSVFASVRAILADLGLGEAQVDPRSRELGINRLRMVRRLGKKSLSTFLSCGEGLTGPNADTWHVFLNLGARVRSAAQGSELELRFTAEAVDVPNGRNERLPCSTTGLLEMQIVDRLNDRFAAPAPAP